MEKRQKIIYPSRWGALLSIKDSRIIPPAAKTKIIITNL